MEHFVYKGIIADYKIIDGKIIVSSVFYKGKQHDCEHTFGSLGEMRRFVDAGGWGAE